MRCAINFTPPADHPLTVAATRWIGRDVFTGGRVEGIETAGLTEADRAYLTAPARRYGFHGTLKAPFRLMEEGSLKALEASLRTFVAGRVPVTLPRMSIAMVEDFFALIPEERSPALTVLATDIVRGFDHFRAPLDELDFARRGRWRMTDRQLAHLLNWGYPYIFEDFRFHMTLTGPVPTSERAHIAVVLDKYFGALATAPLTIDTVAIYFEPEPYAPFVVHSVCRMTSEPALRIA